MTNKWIISLIWVLFLLVLAPCSLQGQFINFELEVESEMSARVEQSLNFGEIVSGAGKVVVNLGDVNMGVFSITTFSSQTLLIDITKPEYLVIRDNPLHDRIPISLFINYSVGTNSTTDQSMPISNGNARVSLYDHSNGLWEKVLIYLYGTIEIGDISGGNYTGDVVLTVQYL